MSDILKFLVFASVAVLLAWAGFVIYKRINKRILDSQTGWQIFFNAMLLLLSLSAVFSLGVYFLIWIYGVLSNEPSSGTTALF